MCCPRTEAAAADVLTSGWLCSGRELEEVSLLLVLVLLVSSTSDSIWRWTCRRRTGDAAVVAAVSTVRTAMSAASVSMAVLVVVVARATELPPCRHRHPRRRSYSCVDHLMNECDANRLDCVDLCVVVVVEAVDFATATVVVVAADEDESEMNDAGRHCFATVSEAFSLSLSFALFSLPKYLTKYS